MGCTSSALPGRPGTKYAKVIAVSEPTSPIASGSTTSGSSTSGRSSSSSVDPREKAEVVEQPAYTVLQQARQLLEASPTNGAERAASKKSAPSSGPAAGEQRPSRCLAATPVPSAASGERRPSRSPGPGQRRPSLSSAPSAGSERRPSRSGPAVQQPTVLVEQRLPIVTGAKVEILEASSKAELSLSRPSMLTEVEVVVQGAVRSHSQMRFELFVNGSTNAVRCCVIPDDGEVRPRVGQGPSPRVIEKVAGTRCKLQLVEPVDDVNWLVLSAMNARAGPRAVAAMAAAGSAPSSAAGEGPPRIREITAIGLPAGSEAPRRRLVRPPPYWQASEASAVARRVDMDSAEQLAVFQRLLDETWKAKATRDRKGALPKRLIVRKAQRVEAPVLWNQYSRCRRRVGLTRGGKSSSMNSSFGSDGAGCTPIARLGPGKEKRPVRTQAICEAAPELFGPCDEKCQEHYLFHGTSPAGALGIIRDGFDVARAGDGSHLLFGPGAYFAECSSKFDEYARPDEFSGLCAVLVCRVACGELLHAQKRLEQEVLRDPTLADRYDGVLGDREASVGTYREFVVFDQEQVYPEYIIFYDRQQ